MKSFKVAIHGVPRSGTSWIGSIFDSSKNVVYRNQPLFSFAFKSFLNEESSGNEIDDFFESISKSNDDYITQKEGKNNGLIPDFDKGLQTHIVYKEARYHHILPNMLSNDKDVKVVGIIRNPKSVISSWMNAPKEFNNKEWDIFTEWKDANLKNLKAPEEFYGYNKWKETALNFLELKNKYPKRFYILNYKTLLNDTENEVRNLFSFCNISIDSQTINFLKKGQNIDLSHEAYSVYRKNQKDDKWKNHLPIQIINEIDKDLIKSGLELYIN
ncbi:sulfotransferase domain-containing protein [Lutibacter flavus]|uniref:Sulfotransferase domain-containing protein n=1 Tax=Lutibacter flavus TaxID=691689 RepID=A0A238YZI1_9FLAO|nr:sulfotransferase domain-containing protein [Lutibacter flavus]SNR75969.1 Sulfotransferase domain-containing protein [Lutibacter flavus]